MKTKTTAVLAIAAIVVSGLIYTASAASLNQNPEQSFDSQKHGKGFRHGGRRLARMARFLDLTEDQKAQIKALFEAEKPKIEPIVRSLAENRKEMREATKGGVFNEAQVRALAAQRAQTLGELIVSKERIRSQIYNVLTPEQRQKAEQMHDRMRERFQERMREHRKQTGEQ